MTTYFFDVETLGIESTSIVLSAAILYVDPEEEFTYQDLIDRALFVKFDSVEQKKAGRTVDQGTLDWWNKQDVEVKKQSFARTSEDLTAVEGLGRINEYIKNNGSGHVWARGSLDQMVIESLGRTFDIKPFAHYNSWNDIRTALRVLKETVDSRGYCEIPNFNKSIVKKHDPVHDIAYDAMMLFRGV